METAEIFLSAGDMRTASDSKELAAQRRAIGKAGKEGERALNAKLKPVARSLGAERLNDLLLWKDRANLIGTQIDSLLVTRQGVYCVEMKNYCGSVRGKQKDRMWQYASLDGIHKNFYNPILQNHGHLAAVRNALGEAYSHVPVKGLIVFSDKCDLHIKPGGAPVVNLKDVPDYFKAEAKKEPVLSEDDVHKIAAHISSQNDKSKEGRRAHLEKAIKSKDENIQKRLPEESRDLGPVVVPTKFESELFIRNKAGQYQNIKDIYMQSLRAADGGEVRTGHPAHTFVCPYTGKTFSAKYADILYDGLVASYLRSDPKFAKELVDIKAHGRIVTGTQRFDRALNRYAEDPHKFAERVFHSDWYQNVAATRQRKMDDIVKDVKSRTMPPPVPETKPRKLDDIINDAKSRSAAQQPHNVGRMMEQQIAFG